ncbi:NAD(P)H-dependent oxidoreductase [Paraflavitalea speifideaquila]|uniref:NAD(P)H-dependent oxidoreductase n=1 Tax=Paraflavitalea speifideaquila TaxID=3076558 RepID=UPI0028E32E30|nr:NAD(P)H-dependent oxidoreductase [Paraflavitalea speifideiaquila]
MESIQKKILILNGSIRGQAGNSWALARKAAGYLETELATNATVLTLTDPMPSIRRVYEMLVGCDGLLVVSGVYWNSWSSPLQRFIEVSTAFENTAAFWGKPVACGVSMDSVGGLEVASRLHGVFSGLGCWSPPCSTLVLSRVGQEAIAASSGQVGDANEDVWRPADMEVVLKNLVRGTHISREGWLAWPHVELPLPDGPWPVSGSLDMGTARFL